MSEFNVEEFGKRLVDMAFPPLSGKSFLQVGGDLGFFSGYAYFEGASKVIGISQFQNEIDIAQSLFPQCTFLKMAESNIEDCLDSTLRYDIILFYPISCQSPEMLNNFPKLMASLKRGGILVMEINICPEEIPDGWLTLPVGGIKYVFPCPSTLHNILSPYAYKGMADILSHMSGSILTKFLHITNLRPYAILLTGPSGSGKTTIANDLFKSWNLIHGDSLMVEIVNMQRNTLPNYPYLNELCGGKYKDLSVGSIMIEIFNSAAGKEYACLVAEKAGLADFVYEGVIHKNFINVFIRQLEAIGYMVLVLDTPDPAISPKELFAKAREESRKYQIYLEKYFHCLNHCR